MLSGKKEALEFFHNEVLDTLKPNRTFVHKDFEKHSKGMFTEDPFGIMLSLLGGEST